MPRYLCWDFDGTLAVREGMWSGAVRDAILRHLPGHSVAIDAIKVHLRRGFPWHTPEVEHHHLTSGDAWWRNLEPTFDAALNALDVDADNRPAVIQSIREEYLRPAAWKTTVDAVAVIAELSTAGWKHVIVSNHVPELPGLIDGLGLAPYFERVFCSAAIGVEKPNERFFQHVLSSFPDRQEVWVIGDSVRADIASANAAGLPSILVGSSHVSARHSAGGLAEIPAILSSRTR